MAKAFLGVGTGFPIKPTPSPPPNQSVGTFAVAQYEESVRQSLLIILGTAKGERVMRPDFGCGIHDLVFENVSPGMLGRVQQVVHETLATFEPRIDVIVVEVRVGDKPNILLIDIEYEVRATNNAFNLVYPFYLDQGAPT